MSMVIDTRTETVNSNRAEPRDTGEGITVNISKEAMETLNQTESNNVNVSLEIHDYNAEADKDTSNRILSDKALRKIVKFHSFVTYFLAGSFFGLAIGGTLEQFGVLSKLVIESFDVHTISAIFGSGVAIICKIIFSLK